MHPMGTYQGFCGGGAEAGGTCLQAKECRELLATQEARREAWAGSLESSGSCPCYIGMPLLSKVCLTPLLFREKPTITPVFSNVKKFEDNFHFHTQKKKTEKLKIALSLYFVARGYRGSTPQQQGWYRQAPSQRAALSFSARATVALDCA